MQRREADMDEAATRQLLAIASSNNYSRAQEAIQLGADVNAKDEFGNTPVMLAVMSHQPELADLLIQHGADVNAKDIDGRTALHYAVARDRADIVRLLIERGADVNARDSTQGLVLTPLRTCGATPLHWAALLSNEDIGRQLIEHGADMNAKDINGRTPLQLARRDNRWHMIELLEGSEGARWNHASHAARVVKERRSPGGREVEG
jgi:ankyrin repeat protein